MWTGFNWLRTCLAGSYEYGNEPLGSIKGSDFFWLAEWLLASEEVLCSMELVIIKNTRISSRAGLNIWGLLLTPGPQSATLATPPLIWDFWHGLAPSWKCLKNRGIYQESESLGNSWKKCSEKTSTHYGI